MKKIIKEEYYTAEFVKDYNGIEVEYNSKVLSLPDFLNLGKKEDTGVIEILSAIKTKMKELNWKDSLYDFIDYFFADNNSAFDVVVIVKPNGKKILKFDTVELSKKY